MVTNQILARKGNATAVVCKGMQQQIAHLRTVNATSVGDKATLQRLVVLKVLTLLNVLKLTYLQVHTWTMLSWLKTLLKYCG